MRVKIEERGNSVSKKELFLLNLQIKSMSL